MTTQAVQPTRLPDVNKISFSEPFHWLALAWSDLRTALVPCLIYGLGLAAVSAGLTLALFYSGAATWIMVLAGGFLFLAPMLAMGLYEAGRQLETGTKPRLTDMIFVRTASARELAYLGLALLIIYFFWTRMAQVIYGLSTYKVHETVTELIAFALFDPNGQSMAITGTIVGGIIAFLLFTLVVVSAPMLLERNSDVFSSSVTSFRAVARNPGPMLLWAILITILTIIGIASAFVGLIIIFPWIGLASWRAYRTLVTRPA